MWFAILLILTASSCARAPESRQTREAAAVHTTSTQDEEKSIRALLEGFSAAVKARDVNAIMAFYAPGDSLVAFDAFPPRQYAGNASYRKAYENFFAAFPGPVTSEVIDLHVDVSSPMANTYGIDKWVATGSDGKPMTVFFRFTDVLRKFDNRWLIVHEHLSVPVDPVTGQADFQSKP
jgi:ketosteroid isomerase-like protein